MTAASPAWVHPTQDSALARVFDVLERAAEAADRLDTARVNEHPAKAAQEHGRDKETPDDVQLPSGAHAVA